MEPIGLSHTLTLDGAKYNILSNINEFYRNAGSRITETVLPNLPKEFSPTSYFTHDNLKNEKLKKFWKNLEKRSVLDGAKFIYL